MRIFQSMLTALVGTPILNGPLRSGILGKRGDKSIDDDPHAAVAAVLHATGDVSSLIYAETLLDQIEAMDDASLDMLVTHIASDHDLNAGALSAAAESYTSAPDAKGLARISRLAEPGWIELFRRLNATTGGTVRLVRLRERLLTLARSNPMAERLDQGLKRLLKMWFNPGFLMLQPIDWTTPANILEKIIAYEAVHAISSWDDLRARLAPEDRRCFAFFHPTMPDEPLIFVEVALTVTVPQTIDSVLQIDRNTMAAEDATTAVFYSISNCQAGLAGISFGNFLIKRVAQELRGECTGLTKFVTLSPVPGLMRWLQKTDADLAAALSRNDDAIGNEEADGLEAQALQAALRYFTQSEREDGWPNDPVARFHLGNGAILEQINFAADRSEKGMAQSGGIMVNYLYDLDVVEANHEAFHQTKTVPLSASLTQMIRALKN